MTITAHILRSAVTAPRIHIDFLWMLVILFGSVGIGYLILTFVLKRRLSRKEKKTIVLKKDIAPLLSTLLYKANDGSRKEGEDVMNAKVHVKELLKNPSHRKKISEVLIDIRADLPGEPRLRILKMYQDFGLHEDAIQRLQSWRWEEVCRGINELTQMQVTGAYTYIRKYINDSRSIVRKQAQLAMVALKPEGIVYFLDHAKHAISEWQQLKILETLQELPDFNPPRFRLWLTSKNKHVVLFAMRLIRSFDQDDAMVSILKLVKHRDDTIKVEAIRCIRDFKYKEAIPLFKRIFRNCRSEVKLAVLNAIGELGDEQDIPFLQFVEQHATDHVIKSKAISTINALAPETILPSDQINEALAEDPFILDERHIEDRLAERDKAGGNEDHEGFQDVMRSAEFKTYKADFEDENLFFEWASNEGLLDIPVHVEILEGRSEAEGNNLKPEEEHSKEDLHRHPLSAQDRQDIQTPDGKDSLDRVVSRASPQDDDSTEELLHGHEFRPFQNPSDHVGQQRFIEKLKDEEEGVEPLEENKAKRRGDQVVKLPLTTVVPDFNLARTPYELESSTNTQQPAWDDAWPQDGLDETDSSYFEKIFRHLSEEMKLSLLTDILKLGDTRDLVFLRKLGHDRSARVRQNARHTFEMLCIREGQKSSEDEVFSIPDTGFLTLDELAFEIDTEVIHTPGMMNGAEAVNSQTHHSQGKESDQQHHQPVKHSDG